MKIKNKLGLPLFLLAFFVVMACSLGSVSAANEIHDVKIDDTNTYIQHPEANIQDSFINNFLKNTDYTYIYEADHGAITSCNMNNAITDSDHSFILQGYYGGVVLNSKINNAITDSERGTINQGLFNGIIQNSEINNAITDSNQQPSIFQGVEDGHIGDSTLNNALISSNSFEVVQASSTFGNIQDSTLNNAVIGSNSGKIWQGFDSNIQDSTLNNTVIGSDLTRMRQDDVFSSHINNVTLFSNNTKIFETNLSGVNGLFIAIGCNDYTKTIENLTNTNFFNLTIGNLEIFNFHW